METSEILKKVRQIEIKTRGLSNNIFAGQYHSAFKGRGMSFSEVREYQFGDDIRDIDWNVTARFNKPYVKVFEEERELTVMLMVDVSGSLEFGTVKQLKKDMVTEIAATLAFSAIQNNDKIGVIFFSDRIEKLVHLIVEPYYEGMPMPETYKFNGQEFKMNVKGVEEVPLEWGGKLVFVNSIVGGSIDARFMPAILKGIMSRMEQGPLTGSYARDVRVIVYDGKMHPVDSNEISFMLAGRNAFSEAFKNAGPKILEPIYDVEVFVPSDKMGDVMGDLQGRRAMIMGMSSEAGYEKLIAKVPLKEMSSYSTALSSLTGGRASFIMKFASYELVPSDVQDKLIKEFEAKQADE